MSRNPSRHTPSDLAAASASSFVCKVLHGEVRPLGRVCLDSDSAWRGRIRPSPGSKIPLLAARRTNAEKCCVHTTSRPLSFPFDKIGHHSAGHPPSHPVKRVSPSDTGQGRAPRASTLPPNPRVPCLPSPISAGGLPSPGLSPSTIARGSSCLTARSRSPPLPAAQPRADPTRLPPGAAVPTDSPPRDPGSCPRAAQQEPAWPWAPAQPAGSPLPPETCTSRERTEPTE